MQIIQGDYEKGFQLVKRAVDQDPQTTNEAIDLIGEAGMRFLEAGMHSAAISCYRFSLDLGSKNLFHNVGLGRALEGAGEPDAALEAYREVIRNAPESPTTAGRIDAIYEARGDALGRTEEWRRLAADQPEAAEPQWRLGLACEAADQKEAALAAYRQVLANKPEFEQARERIKQLSAKTP